MFPTHVHNYEPHLRAYVEGHLHEPIHLADLAARMHMSPSHYCHAFQRATGQSPMRVVRQTRLERAQELLRTTEQSIGQIAAAVGYKWTTHFCKTFRQHLGLSPELYRVLHQTQDSWDTLPQVVALWPQVGPETKARVLLLLAQAAHSRGA